MKKDDLDEQIDKLDQLSESIMRKYHDYILQSSVTDLTPVQQYLLKVLSKQGSSTPSEIAHLMGVTSGAVTSLTDRLCKQGYIIRERSKEDRRLVIIKFTAEGEKMAELVEQERKRKMRQLYSAMKPESIRDLCEIYSEMDKVIDLLQEN